MDKTETSKENLEYTILKQNLVEAVWQIFYLEDLLARHNISFGNKAFQEFKAKNPLKQAEVKQKIKNALANGNASSSVNLKVMQLPMLLLLKFLLQNIKRLQQSMLYQLRSSLNVRQQQVRVMFLKQVKSFKIVTHYCCLIILKIKLV